jgi:hypothetical protein
MGLLDKLKRKVETTLAGSRLEEELMYKHAIREMDAGLIREGLYAKALSNSPGDEEKVKSLYIKYRVQSIKDELKGVSYPEYMNTLKLNVRKMKKSELIGYAVAKGAEVKDTDTIATILKKLRLT